LLCLANGFHGCGRKNENERAEKLNNDTFVVVLLQERVEAHGVFFKHALAAFQGILPLLCLNKKM
jgi:putative ribosome biogenesis GTPase RsgA